MKKNCDKFESLFIFSSEDDFKNHIETCEDCKQKNEEFNKISALIQEAKPFYLEQKRQRKNQLKAVCAMALLFLSGTCLSLFNMGYLDTNNFEIISTMSPEDYGFPVDSYGFIMVDE